MDVELAECKCCGLKEDCTPGYIAEVKAKFDGKWLCGLCSEAVRDEAIVKGSGIDEAMTAHMSFRRERKLNNPAFHVADGMKQMLRRRRSANLNSPSKKYYYSRSSSACAPPSVLLLVSHNK